MLSGQIGQYKYYTLEDMSKSEGCVLCKSRVKWGTSLSGSDLEKEQHEVCIRCPVFMAVTLTKIYAEELDEYKERLIDDGR